MQCWKCGAALSDPPEGKLPFKATCDVCVAWLHCCRNCKNYKPGMPNDCLIPGTDPIADREAANYCEEFHLLGHTSQKSADVKKISQKLFGEDTPDSTKDPNERFKNLFGD